MTEAYSYRAALHQSCSCVSDGWLRFAVGFRLGFGVMLHAICKCQHANMLKMTVLIC